jgi:hypothetical protein
VKRVLAIAALALAPAGPAAAASGTGVSYRATLAPREALFGDALDARVDVVVDPTLASPSSVRVNVDLRPYRAVSVRRSEDPAGGLTRVQFRYRLLCLRRPCLPNGPERTFRFAPVRIGWRGTDGRPQVQAIFWPPLRLASRLDPKDLRELTMRSDVVRQPPVTWGVQPGTAIAVLLLAAAALLVYPMVLVVRAARRGWYRLRTSRLERMTPLERALELLRRATARGEDAQSRRALERLARELHGEPLAADAERLAWSRPRPEQDEIETLRTRVEGDGR